MAMRVRRAITITFKLSYYTEKVIRMLESGCSSRRLSFIDQALIKSYPRRLLVRLKSKMHHVQLSVGVLQCGI